MASAAPGGQPGATGNQEAATVEDGTRTTTGQRQGEPAGARLPGVVALLAGLLLVVAAGTGGGPRGRRSGHASPLAVRAVVDVGLGAVAVVVVLLAGALVSALWIGRRKKEPPAAQRVYQAPQVPWALRIGLLVFLLLLGTGVVAVLRGGTRQERPSRPVPLATGQLPVEEPPPTGKRAVGGDAAAIAAVAAVGLTTAAVLARRARNRRWAAPRAASAEDQPTEVVSAAPIGVGDLLADPDPRRAVVAAYARMERVLAAAGVARPPSDTPFEYLDRISRALAAAAPPATRLTELFERAKFSAAPVDLAMQTDAVAALWILLDRVEVPA